MKKKSPIARMPKTSKKKPFTGFLTEKKRTAAGGGKGGGPRGR